ncbi:MAG: restriction endonuclease subunit S [Pseudomonadota bacterium]
MSEAVPSGWKRVTFKSICRSLVNGGTPDTGNGKYWGGNTPWVTGADFTSNGIGEIRRYVSEAGIRTSSTNVVRAGNLLLVTRTGVGKLAIAPSDIAISQDITGVYLDENQADTGFVYFLMKRGVEDLKKRNQGTSINGIIRSDLEGYVVQIPYSIPEQKRIASILATIERAIEKTESLIAKYQQIKAGLMHDLFTRGVTPDGKLRPPREQAPELYQETPIGWIPKEWDVVLLNSVSQVERGKFTARPRNDPKFFGGNYPFIQTGDVSANVGRRLYSYSQTLNETGASISKSFPEGAIMVTIAANIADTCVLGIPMFAPDSVVGVVPNPGEAPRFVELCIRRQKSWLYSRAPQSAQKNINLEDLRPLLIPYPESKEQIAISGRYEAIDSVLIELEADCEKLRLLKSGLMHDLLTGRVRVKV